MGGSTSPNLQLTDAKECRFLSIIVLEEIEKQKGGHGNKNPSFHYSITKKKQ